MTPPTVMVLPIENTVALTIARALGRAGVAVLGVGFSATGIGLKSRYLKASYVLEGESLDRVERLLRLVAEVRPTCLMVHGESLMSAVNERRDEFERFTSLMFAPNHVLRRAFDKSVTLAIARDAGIPVPKEVRFNLGEDFASVAAALAYPVVAKPPRSYADAGRPDLHFGYHVIDNSEALAGFMARFAGAPFLPLVQEFHPGHGVGVEVLMREGHPVAVFQHRRIREYPITGGPSVYRRSEPADPVLVNWAVDLLARMEWEGVAMVEFRQDPEAGRSVLMEVNGRFWGSLPLAIHAGVNFPLLLLQTHVLGQAVAPPSYKNYRYCRQLSADTKWLIEALKVGRRGGAPCSRLAAVWQYLYSFVQCRHYDLEWLDDPRPAFEFWRRRLVGST